MVFIGGPSCVNATGYLIEMIKWHINQCLPWLVPYSPTARACNVYIIPVHRPLSANYVLLACFYTAQLYREPLLFSLGYCTSPSPIWEVCGWCLCTCEYISHFNWKPWGIIYWCIVRYYTNGLFIVYLHFKELNGH